MEAFAFIPVNGDSRDGFEGVEVKRHTVILGAGATIAAIPDGDKYGRRSSVMNGLIEKLGMRDILERVELETESDNLEDIYSELYSRPECAKEREELEQRLYQYFELLEIPDDPTIYDLLILSLTDKDVIATFNWDPLLLQSYTRCSFITDNLPRIFCLHGNVAVGYCEEHVEFGVKRAVCPVCKNELPPTRLLYPVAHKDYESDDYIRNCWDAVRQAISESYMITIFGYSAPASDRKAGDLLKKAWGDPDDRQIEEITVIDIIDEEEVPIRWKDFIHTHHYQYTNDFCSSYLGTFPRRSCETVFAMFCLNMRADNSKGFRPNASWVELEDQLYDLLCEERDTPEGRPYPLHYSMDNHRH